MYNVLGHTRSGMTVLIECLTGRTLARRLVATTLPYPGSIITDAQIERAAWHAEHWPFWPMLWSIEPDGREVRQ